MRIFEWLMRSVSPSALSRKREHEDRLEGAKRTIEEARALSERTAIIASTTDLTAFDRLAIRRREAGIRRVRDNPFSTGLESLARRGDRP